MRSCCHSPPAASTSRCRRVALQFVDDLPGALGQIRRALKPDGLFMAALLGGETLNELRSAFTAAEAELLGGAAPRIAPFAEVRSLGALLQRAGFALPVVDQDRLTVRYADPFALMRDLRAMGASNALVERSRRPLRRDVLFRAAAIYRDRFADRGRQNSRNLRSDLSFGVGPGPEPAEATRAGLRETASRRRTRNRRASSQGEGPGALADTPSATVSNVVPKEVPRDAIPIIAVATITAMRPYSTAVTPDVDRTNLTASRRAARSARPVVTSDSSRRSNGAGGDRIERGYRGGGR